MHVKGDIMISRKFVPSLTNETQTKIHAGLFSIQELEELYSDIVSVSNKYQKKRAFLQPIFFLSFIPLPLQMIGLFLRYGWWFGWWFREITLYLLVLAVLYQIFYLLFEKLFIYRMEKQFLFGLKQGYPEVPKERLTLNKNLFSAINCRNCGSNGITIREDKVVCEYCNTIFSVRGNSNQSLKIAYIKRPRFPIIRKVLLSLGLLVCISGIALNISETGGRPVGVEGIHVVEGWSQELFESIELARRESDSYGGFQYVDGGSFSDLITHLPKPRRIDTDISEDSTLIAYTWESSEFEDYHLFVRIAYDEESGLIIRKHVHGNVRFRARGSATSHVLGLEYIESIQGWTQSIYEDIVTATEHRIFCRESEEENLFFSDGGNFQDLVYSVGRPQSVFVNEWNGTISATWRSDPEFRDAHATVTVTYCEETEMIVWKSIHGFR
jgi:hypothetical protein